MKVVIVYHFGQTLHEKFTLLLHLTTFHLLLICILGQNQSFEFLQSEIAHTGTCVIFQFPGKKATRYFVNV